MAQFIRARLSEELIGNLELLFSTCTSHLEALNSEDLQKLAELSQHTINCIWEVKKSLIEIGTEENFWTESGQKYTSIKSALETFQASLKQRFAIYDVQNNNPKKTP